MNQNGYNPDDFDLVGLTSGEASEFIGALNEGRLPADVEEALNAARSR